jgi:hypothetical protein
MDDNAADQATNPVPGADAVPAPAATAVPAAAPMPTPTPAAPVASAASSTGQADWPAKVADTIEDVVDAVHDRVVRPLSLVARGLVFGIIVGVMALVLSVLAVIAVIRLLDVYAFGGRVWASDALFGVVLVGGGVLAWTKRGARTEEA